MYLKIKEMKEMKGSKLTLDLTNGTYIIGVQAPALKIGNIDYNPVHIEIIEEYDSMDYKLEEVIERFNIVYNLLDEREEY